MKSMVDISHLFLEKCLHPGAICLDATLGQGKDTDFFLGRKALKVYAFDIQKEPVEKAREHFDPLRVEIFNASHDQMDALLDPGIRFDAAVFNFGWYPGGNHEVVTIVSSSLTALKKTVERLRPKGRLALVFYPHEEGNEEKQALMPWIESQTDIDYVSVEPSCRHRSPSLCLIEKKGKSL